MKISIGLNTNLLNSDEYIDFINTNAYSTYFSLSMLPDARGVTSTDSDIVYILERLKLLTCKKYLVCNGIMASPDVYIPNSVKHLQTKYLMQLVRPLIDGIVFYDLAFLTMFQSVLSGIDMIPTVNFSLDSISKIESMLSHMQLILGQLPSKLSLDRSLNRDHNKLVSISEHMRKKYPEIELELVVNEGCILNCPYKNAHDCNIAVSSWKNEISEFMRIACHRYHFKNDFKFILTSPFVRPEDLDKILPYIDVIKIAGRNFDFETQKDVVLAYQQKFYYMNLCNLIEVFRPYKEGLFINSDLFPPNFYDITSSCEKNCSTCMYCVKVFEKHAHIFK